jgi:hypothetical protein
MILGQQITKKFTTGRLYAQLNVAGVLDAFWRDLGNVEDYKLDPKLTRKEHMASGAGVKRTDLSLIADITQKYSLTFDEFTNDLEALLALGTQGADAVQNAGNIVNEALTAASKQTRVYFCANMGLSAFTLKVGGNAMVLGVDYSVDLPSGAVTILAGGGIADASAVTVSYTAAAITNHVFTGFNNLIVQGNFKLVEYDQFSNVTPRQINTFNGQLYVTNWGDNKEDFTKVVAELLVFGNPTINRRAD